MREMYVEFRSGSLAFLCFLDIVLLFLGLLAFSFTMEFRMRHPRFFSSQFLTSKSCMYAIRGECFYTSARARKLYC